MKLLYVASTLVCIISSHPTRSLRALKTLPPHLCCLCTPQLPTDPRVLCDRRVSANACSVTAFEAGRGVALRLELTHDIVDPAVFLQVKCRAASAWCICA